MSLRENVDARILKEDEGYLYILVRLAREQYGPKELFRGKEQVLEEEDLMEASGGRFSITTSFGVFGKDVMDEHHFQSATGMF